MDRPADTAISLRSVTKSFDLWNEPSARLLGALRALVPGVQAPEPQKFTAVREVSLEIPRGACVGIIGRNGAGKSTLLQLIAGTLQPTAGEIRVNGRVAALLELGSGFNPDFTGRENIHLNAAILGLNRQEIAAKFDAIAAYSGIEEFIDRPVRTYSSGMTVRLAFAVCVHVDADILIIDEALAVGDARFQFKCHATLDQMIGEGRTVLFVSHDTNAVKRMCRTAVLMERGELVLQGTPNDVTNIYTKLITSPHGIEAVRADIAALKEQGGEEPFDVLRVAARKGEGSPVDGGRWTVDGDVGKEKGEGGREKEEKGLGYGIVETGGGSREQGVDEIQDPGAALRPTSSPAASTETLLTEERAHRQVSDKEYTYGGELGAIESIEMLDTAGQPRLAFTTGQAFRVRLRCWARAAIPSPIYALTLKDVRGQEIYGTNTYFQGQATPDAALGSRWEVVFDVTANLLPGVYFASLGWVRLENAEVVVVHRRYDALRFEIVPRDRSFGIAYCPTTITVNPA